MKLFGRSLLNYMPNPPIPIYISKINDKLVLKITDGYKLELKTPETMKLFGRNLLNYVPYVFLYATCLMPYVLSCLLPYVLTCLVCFVPYMLSYLTCLMPYVFSCPMFLAIYMLSCLKCCHTSCSPCLTCLAPYVHFVILHALHAPYVPCILRASCQTCSRVSHVLRAVVPHVSCTLGILWLLVSWTLHTLVLLDPDLVQVFQA